MVTLFSKSVGMEIIKNDFDSIPFNDFGFLAVSLTTFVRTLKKNSINWQRIFNNKQILKKVFTPTFNNFSVFLACF